MEGLNDVEMIHYRNSLEPEEDPDADKVQEFRNCSEPILSKRCSDIFWEDSLYNNWKNRESTFNAISWGRG